MVGRVPMILPFSVMPNGLSFIQRLGEGTGRSLQKMPLLMTQQSQRLQLQLVPNKQTQVFEIGAR